LMLQAGETYYLGVNGAGPNAADYDPFDPDSGQPGSQGDYSLLITATNPNPVLDAGAAANDGLPDTFTVRRDGADLVVFLGGAAEIFRQAESETESLTINGSGDADTLTVDLSFGDFDLTGTFHGGGGADTSIVLSNAMSDEQVSLRANGVQLDGTDAISFTAVEQSYFYGQPGDSALLFDSSGTDFFVSDGTYAYVAGLGDGTFRLASGVGFLYGYSSGQAGDNAWHYDTAGVDSYVPSGTAYSYMSGQVNGQSFFNVGVGFAVSYAYSTEGGSDFAYFLDSAGNDTLYVQDDATGDYAYMSGTGFFSVAQDFEAIFGQSFVGGMDTAYNFAPHKTVLAGFATVFTGPPQPPDADNGSDADAAFATNTAWNSSDDDEDDLSALDELMSDADALDGMLG
ncbi:MAG: hypothetical protein ACREJB_01160, partial [Planctomycetaceae bacterium]